MKIEERDELLRFNRMEFEKWMVIKGIEGNLSKHCNMLLRSAQVMVECLMQSPVCRITDSYSRDGLNDEIDRMLPVGIELYSAPVAKSKVKIPDGVFVVSSIDDYYGPDGVEMLPVDTIKELLKTLGFECEAP